MGSSVTILRGITAVTLLLQKQANFHHMKKLLKIRLLCKLQSYRDSARKCNRTTDVNANKGAAIQILLHIPQPFGF